MHASKTTVYKAFGIRIFRTAEEVWEYFKDRGTPEEREGLKQLFRLERQAKAARERPSRRRRA